MKKSISDKTEKYCKYCEKAQSLSDTDSMLCSKNGIVSASHSCCRFSYDPLKRSPATPSQEIKLEYIKV